jgi:hypothetical protein
LLASRTQHGDLLLAAFHPIILSQLADVFTFHAYCKQLLHKNPKLRDGLTEKFVVYPKLASLVKSDWSLYYKDVEVPQFVGLMRQAIDNEATRFFTDRSNYYDAVSFDSMVFRVFERLNTAPQKHLLPQIVPTEYRERILKEAHEYAEPPPPEDIPEPKVGQPTIR